MSRAVLILHTAELRRRAHEWIDAAAQDSRVEFKGPKRTLPQNDRMWAMLTDISTQAEHYGRRYAPGDWKVIFLSALGRETRFVPNLDGTGLIPIGQSSSDLSVAEMSDMIESMFAWGAQHAIVFHEPDDARPFAPIPESVSPSLTEPSGVPVSAAKPKVAPVPSGAARGTHEEAKT